MFSEIKNNILNEENWVKLEIKLNDLENKLSELSGRTVVLAPVVGPLKILGGIIQAIAGGILGISSIGTRLADDAELAMSLKRHSWDHIKHGFSNMLAGLIESIPLLSSAALGLRYLRNPGIRSSRGIEAETHDWNKYRPYLSIAKRRMELVEGTTEKEKAEKMENAKKIFDFAYPNVDARDKASYQKMKEDACLASLMAEVNYPYEEDTYPRQINQEAVVERYNKNRGFEAVQLNLDGKPNERIVFTGNKM